MQFWRPATLLIKTPTQMLSSEICKIFKNNCFEEHLWTISSKLYLKRDYNTGVFLYEFCELFKSTFKKHLWMAGFKTSLSWFLFHDVTNLTVWRPSQYFGKTFFVEHSLATTSRMILCFLCFVFFFNFADQWGLQSKIKFLVG